MRTIVVAAVVLVLCALGGGPHPARADADCMELGWIEQGGEWKWVRAWIDRLDENELHIRYEHHHGRMKLHVTEKEAADGEDVYVFKGEWHEDHGREGGKVRLVLKKGHKHAKGFYTLGGWDAPRHELKLGDCTHVR